VKFKVTDRYSIERGIRVRTSYVVISIRDPGKPKPRIPKPSGFRAVLYLAFHDAEPSETLALPENIVLMTKGQARKVWKFVRRWEGQVGSIVVHCEQGMSRSPAVAAAICRALGGDHQYFFDEYQPNQYIFQLMNSEMAALSGH
jgi:predicted protein tyrosine phosphatase